MKWTIIALLILAGCSNKPDQHPVWRTVPTTDEERQSVKEMIIRLCDVSNPHSDEEPEDMISQAESTACRVLCKPTLWIWDCDMLCYYPTNL